MASSNANPVEVPEADITILNSSADFESQSNVKEPQPNIKTDDDFEDFDPVDEEESLVSSKPIRVRRAIVFRPLFVYRQEQEQRLIAADRRNGRASEGHHGQGHGQGQRHGHGNAHNHQHQHNEQNHHNQHGY